MELGSQISGGGALSKENYINLGAFILNALFVNLGNTGIFGATNAVVSRKYQSLITPAGWAFSIWAIIYVWEAVFAVAQMLPMFRSNRLVTAICYPWTAVCLGQVIWTVTFSQELITVSFVALFAVWAGLLAVCWRQERIFAEDIKLKQTNKTFWLLSVPFQIHLGWVTAATALNLNLVFSEREAGNAALLLSVAILTIAALTVAVQALCEYSAVGFVIAWASAAISSELSNPDESITATFPLVVIEGVRHATMALSIVIALLTFGNVVAFFVGLSRDKAARQQPFVN